MQPPTPIAQSDIHVGGAFTATSFSPEKREQSAKTDYVDTMNDVWNNISARITEENRDRVAAEFTALKTGYAARLTAYYSAHSRVMSSMITGPSSFPVRSNQKKSATADKRASEALEWLTRGRKRLSLAIAGPLDRSPQTELAKAVSNLATREAHQTAMKAVNAAHKRFLKNPDSLDKSKLSDDQKKSVMNYKSAYSWEPHPFPPYALTNNNAQIRRLRGRVTEMEARASIAETADGPQTFMFDGGSVELDYQEQYIRITHDEKPDTHVRQTLKARGFHWSPSNVAWQRKLTDNAKAVASEITGVCFTTKE